MVHLFSTSSPSSPFPLPPPLPPALPSLFLLGVLGSCLLSRLTDSVDSRTSSLHGPCFLSLFSFCMLPLLLLMLASSTVDNGSFKNVPCCLTPAKFNGSKSPFLFTSFFLSDLTSAFPGVQSHPVTLSLEFSSWKLSRVPIVDRFEACSSSYL